MLVVIGFSEIALLIVGWYVIVNNSIYNINIVYTAYEYVPLHSFMLYYIQTI